jgi:hypothetical protein
MDDINSLPEVNEGVVVYNLNPDDVMTIQAVFGAEVSKNPKIQDIINHGGPVLFASVLFSMCEEWKIDESNPLGAIQTKSVVEAEELAIGWVRSVAQAMSKYYEDGEISLSPTDSEIDEDTSLISPH